LPQKAGAAAFVGWLLGRFACRSAGKRAENQAKSRESRHILCRKTECENGTEIAYITKEAARKERTVIQKIEEIIDEKVRPALLAHEGDVQVLSYQDGICRIRLTGKCSGCPSASITTEELIAEEIQNALPEVKDVVLVQEVSEELQDLARRILNHEQI
jgi:Fe-S cluster biogenesis protein NfuA